MESFTHTAQEPNVKPTTQTTKACGRDIQNRGAGAILLPGELGIELKSLRGAQRRGNLMFVYHDLRGDCFASLAMTGLQMLFSMR